LEEIDLKKRTLKILYMSINGIITLVALNIFKKYISFTDDYVVAKLLIHIIVVLLLFGANHYLFMKLIFGKDNNNS
jgi:cytochrome c oxidase subunit IV